MMEEWLLLKDGGICRCCALEGPSKDLVSKYSWMGDDEIYSDMLRECFNITLVTVEEGSNGGICEVCITQLRSAYKFRQHVLHTEEQFKKKLESKNLCDSAFVKLEIPPETSDTDMDPMGDNDDNSDYEVPLKKIKDELESEMELMKQKKTPAKTIASKSTRTLKKKASVEPETSKKDHASKPRKCMVCGYNYLSIPDLNRHLNNNHDVTEKPKDVLCDTCGKTFSDAMSLRRHKYRYCPKVKPKCTVCGLEFHKESMLEQHMLRGHDTAGNPKKTHRNPRGQVVSNPDALRHGKVSNCAAKKAKCDKCNLVFDKKFEFYRHMRRMHTIVCGLCYISFETHEQQDEHLRDCHKVDIAHHALVFDGEKEFMIWKSRLELESNAYFVNRVSDDGSGYYRCCLKTCLGRNDLPSTVQNCPARIKVSRATDTNQLIVSYQSGHICTIKLTRKCDRKLQCSECKHVVDNFEQLYSHLEGQHQVPINVQHLKFRSEQGVGAPRKRKKKKGEASATPERTEHRVNLTAILQYSNASPFRDKTMHGFTCLYCCKHFQHIDDLRQHTAQQSEKDKLNKMIDYKLSYNPIKVDITDLECTICGMQMTDLNDLKEHLAEMHKKVIFKDIKDIILPFRLYDGTNYTCVACSEKHISFKNLYHHMSNHYRNYCCNICGAGYITIAALRKHGKTHEKGNFKCSYCDKVYSSEAKKRNHEKGVHTGGWLRNKCPHCPEIFVSYYDRSEHLVRVHNEKPVTYPCNACNKIYKKKFELNRHIKHHHLQQRNYMCDMCNAKFFSKRGLVDHMSRHLGGDVFNCDVCGRSFSRQRTLRDHMKAHEGDKRFECEICHKNFMQKSSLKSHVRLHQDDLDIFKEFDDVKHLIDDREMTLKQIAAENKKKMEGDRMRNIL